MTKTAGKVLKTMRPGAPGTKTLVKKYGSKLICIRYRVNPQRRIISKTIEIVIKESFYDSVGYQNYKRAMSSIRQSV